MPDREIRPFGSRGTLSTFLRPRLFADLVFAFVLAFDMCPRCRWLGCFLALLGIDAHLAESRQDGGVVTASELSPKLRKRQIRSLQCRLLDCQEPGRNNVP